MRFEMIYQLYSPSPPLCGIPPKRGLSSYSPLGRGAALAVGSVEYVSILKYASFIIMVYVFLFPNSLKAQTTDLELLAESGSAPTVIFGQKKKPRPKAFLRFNPAYWLLNGALTGYQKVVSPQISADCLYELSCPLCKQSYLL